MNDAHVMDHGNGAGPGGVVQQAPSLVRPLPPLQAMRAFEAVARHGTVTRAAEELAVTQSAVSHQIRTLEGYLGEPVFVRQPSGLKLSELGRLMIDDVSAAFRALHGAPEAARRRRSGGVVRLSASPAFTAGWLLPRLGQLTQHYPQLRIDLSVDGWSIDGRDDDWDARVGLAAKPRSDTDEDALDLFRERVVPVCSPALLDVVRSPDDLSSVTLIHEKAPGYRELGWDWWLSQIAPTIRSTRTPVVVDQFSLAVSAALDGIGVGLGRLPLIEGHLNAGRLVRLFDLEPVPGGRGHYVQWQRGAETNPRVRSLTRWLAKTAGAATGSSFGVGEDMPT